MCWTNFQKYASGRSKQQEWIPGKMEEAGDLKGREDEQEEAETKDQNQD